MGEEDGRDQEHYDRLKVVVVPEKDCQLSNYNVCPSEIICPCKVCQKPRTSGKVQHKKTEYESIKCKIIT